MIDTLFATVHQEVVQCIYEDPNLPKCIQFVLSQMIDFFATVLSYGTLWQNFHVK